MSHKIDVLDHYVSTSPSDQNALDIFAGEWLSKLPDSGGALRAGHIPLFHDARVEWAVTAMGGVKGKSVLELGPLEGGHTAMLERHGASSITAVEANQRAFLRCLIVKEILRLDRSHFLCGDFMEFLRSNPGKFDVCFASGVLYHLLNPAELIDLAGGVCDSLYLWTHYYEEAAISRYANRKLKFTGSIAAEHKGFRHILYRQEYQEALALRNYCGGTSCWSQWMTRSDILACLEHFGWKNVRINFEVLDHPHGPYFALVAQR